MPRRVDHRKVACDVCGKRLKYKSDLDRHMVIHDPTFKGYPCPVAGCPRRFRQRGNIKSHLNTHTGKKTFECHFCDKLYADAASLSRHETGTHGRSRQREAREARALAKACQQAERLARKRGRQSMRKKPVSNEASSPRKTRKMASKKVVASSPPPSPVTVSVPSTPAPAYTEFCDYSQEQTLYQTAQVAQPVMKHQQLPGYPELQYQPSCDYQQSTFSHVHQGWQSPTEYQQCPCPIATEETQQQVYNQQWMSCPTNRQAYPLCAQPQGSEFNNTAEAAAAQLQVHSQFVPSVSPRCEVPYTESVSTSDSYYPHSEDSYTQGEYTSGSRFGNLSGLSLDHTPIAPCDTWSSNSTSTKADICPAISVSLNVWDLTNYHPSQFGYYANDFLRETGECF